MRGHVELYYPQFDDKLRRYLRFKSKFVDVDEVMQEVWLKVLQYKDEIEYPQQFLRLVTMCTFLNWLDARKRAVLVELTEDDYGSESPEWDLEIDAALLLSKLPPRCRQCFIEHLAGWTTEEIGERLGIAFGTVHKHLVIARKKVQEISKCLI